MSEEINPVVGIDEDGTIKVDMRANAVQEQSTDEVPVRDESEVSEGVPEQNIEEPATEPTREEAPVEGPVEQQPVLQEITEEEVEEAAEGLADEIEEAVAEQAASGIELPENIQKVVDFMNETGGSLEDYVKLNTDYASLNEDQLLREYYEAVYTSYDREDIEFLFSDKFSYDEELDDEREIRLKKLER